MPITIVEKADSGQFERKPDGIQQKSTYIVEGSDSESAIYAAVIAGAPSSITIDSVTVPRYSVSVTPDESHLFWVATVTYQTAKWGSSASIASGNEVSFDTTGGTQLIKNSIKTIARYPSGTGSPDYKGLIGVDEKGEAEGVDIITPRFQYEEKKSFAAASVNSTYMNTLRGLTGCVNDATFRGFAAGEVLFVGARATKNTSTNTYDITFTFNVSPNASSVNIPDDGSPSVVVSGGKKGWEYLWVKREQVASTADQRAVLKPVAAYVEQVYKPADFTALNL